MDQQPPTRMVNPSHGIDQLDVPKDVKAATEIASQWVTFDRDAIAKTLAVTDPEFQRLCKGATLDVKDRGDTFVGRAEELGDTMDRVTLAIKAESQDDKPTGTIIRGAPGAGKSTLMQELQKRLDENGVECVSLGTDSFKTPDVFNEAIKKRTGHRIRAWLKNAGPKARRAGSRTVDALMKTWGLLTMRQGGLPVEADDLHVDIVSQTVEGWESGKRMAVEDSLRTLDFVFPNGVAILVDEAQTIEDQLDNPNAKEGTAALIVRAISTKKGRADMGLKNTTAVFAGLSNTSDVIGKLGSFGLHPIQLQTMEPEQVREYLTSGLREIRPNQDDPIAEAIERIWIPALCEEYGEWTRHAAAARQALRAILRIRGDETLSGPEGWAGVVAMADAIRREVYRDVQEKLTKNAVPETVVDTLTWALAANGNELTDVVTRKLIDSAKAHADQEGRDRSTADTLLRCKNSGLIDTATEKTPNVREKRIYSPIPSLIRNFLRKITTQPERIREWIENEELSTELPKELAP